MSILDKSSSKMQDFLGFIWSFVVMSKSKKTRVISKIGAKISKLLAELIMNNWYNFTLSTLLAKTRLAGTLSLYCPTPANIYVQVTIFFFSITVLILASTRSFFQTLYASSDAQALFSFSRMDFSRLAVNKSILIRRFSSIMCE